MRTQSVVEQFNRDGFAIASNVVCKDQITALLARIADLPSHSARLRDNAVFAQRNLLDHDWVQELASSEAMMRCITPILGDRAFAVRGILFDKTPGANWVVPWHQDLSIAVRERNEVVGYGPWSKKLGVVHVQPPANVLSHMCTVRLHLDECDVDNGPLRVMPGTHRQILQQDQIAQLTKTESAVDCIVPAGGAVLMRPMLVHASSAAKRPGHRRVIHLEYAANELEGGLTWQTAINDVTPVH